MSNIILVSGNRSPSTENPSPYSSILFFVWVEYIVLVVSMHLFQGLKGTPLRYCLLLYTKHHNVKVCQKNNGCVLISIE